jgi:polyhydroxyalkanoate synthesis regulator phasin
VQEDMMAEEPDNVVLPLLWEIRSAQQAQGDVLSQHTGALSRLEKRVEDLYTMSTHTLGVAVSAHDKHLALEARVDQLSERVQRLESKT